jgi:hypothetical protein
MTRKYVNLAFGDVKEMQRKFSSTCEGDSPRSDIKIRLDQCIILSGDDSMGVPYLWDYDIDEAQFRAVLEGKTTIGRLDSDWAAIRILDYAPYPEIVHLLGFRRLVEGWPRWREHVRSQNQRRSFDFLTAWLPVHYPDMVK